MWPASSSATPHSPRCSVFCTSNAPCFSRSWMVALAGCVHPVVERPVEAVRVVLGIGLATSELIGDELLRVHAQVAVGVVHQPDVGRLRDEHAAVEDLHGSREDEAVREHGALVHHAVGVRVLQHDDAADRIVLVRAGDVRHEAGHLDRPEAALGVPVDRHGILNQRLARDQLDAVAGRHVERLQRGLGRERRRVVRDLLDARAARAGWTASSEARSR